MAGLELVIGNKNYSSWSLRPWLAMTVAGLKFKETLIPLDTPRFREEIVRHSGAGRVPVLHHGKIAVWESLAILEYLAEAFPEKNFWPKARAARAMARAVANEMHGGFGALRNACPMNLRRPRKPVPLSDGARKDIARIEALWRQCREMHGKGGPFLFGRFTNADAMYAPVATRFDTYGIEVSAATRAYMKAVMDLPAFGAWRDAGVAEPWRIEDDEVD